ncbi:MAG: LPS export ABC transporter periplasmic protein LptC [Hydrogenophilales bacterium]|nr:LPS export ABC transporter periplasmic protein LptC [Hydrogenophilales bacterium]
MISRGPLWLPLAILLLLAALSFWIERLVESPANGSASPTRTDPEGIMENFNAMRTDMTGKPQYRLTAKKLRHYSNSKFTELESPRFTQLDAQSGDVSAVASQATVSPDGNEVDLRGNVLVERAAHAGQSLMTVRSARLLVYPERDQLRSPGPVEIHDATLNASADTMAYDAKLRILKLTGRVHARYISGKG